MAIKKPLVLGSDGRPQQLQAGDTLANTADTGQINQTAAAALVPGNAVYTSGADAVNKAKADASGTKDVLGLAVTSISSASSGLIQANGVLVLTTTQWDAVAGTTGGLAPNAVYFLDPTTAGKITATAPTTAGQYVAEVGRALSTTEFLIDVRPPILL